MWQTDLGVVVLELTGERVVPQLMSPLNSLLLEHIGRYHFAVEQARGRVLDIACGVGYGSFILAKCGKGRVHQVVGIDLDCETIAYARRVYDHPRCQFRVDDGLDPGIDSRHGRFDTIVSFETLEHLEDDRVFVQNLLSMLTPGGKLVVSTPLGRGRDYPSSQEFHRCQLTTKEFIGLFAPCRQVRFYQQRGLVFRPYQETGDYPIMIGIGTC